MQAQYRAFVVHRTPNRLRIKIPRWRCQNAHFFALQRSLLEHPDVLQVEVNSSAASVVIRYRRGFDVEASISDLAGLEVWWGEEAALVSLLRASPVYNPQPRLRAISARQIWLPLLLLKLVVAVVTKPLSGQLVEWVADALLRAAMHSPPGLGPAVGRQPPRQPLLLPFS